MLCYIVQCTITYHNMKCYTCCIRSFKHLGVICHPGGKRSAEAARALPASRRGQDKWGRRRSAAIPPNEVSRENVGNMWATCGQHMATYGHMCALKTTHDNMYGICGPSVKTPPKTKRRRERRHLCL